MANYRGYKLSASPTNAIKMGFYCPAPENEYDGSHAFLYFYTNFRYGKLMPTPSAPIASMDDEAIS